MAADCLLSPHLTSPVPFGVAADHVYGGLRAATEDAAAAVRHPVLIKRPRHCAFRSKSDSQSREAGRGKGVDRLTLSAYGLGGTGAGAASAGAGAGAAAEAKVRSTALLRATGASSLLFAVQAGDLIEQKKEQLATVCSAAVR